MRIAFLVFYNHFAYGVRCLTSYLEQEGNPTLMLKVKRFITRSFPREDTALRSEIDAGGHLPVFEICPEFSQVCPYPAPLTEIERELIVEQLERFKPDAIGFSLTSSHLPLVIEVSELLRKRFPSIPQLWGGIHPTMDPEGCLKHADIVCVGEGEEALADYANDPARRDIPNLWFRDGDTITRNAMRPLIKDLDALPFPMYGNGELLIEDDRVWTLDDLSPEEVRGQMILNSTRGCPFTCTYCLHGVLRDMYRGQKYLRRKSVDRFIDEIESALARYPLDGLSFWDDIFMMDEVWTEEFCAKYPRRIGLPFGGNCHPRMTNRRILQMLHDAGAFFVTIGLQSGSTYISDQIYGRRVSTERMLEFGRDLVEIGYEAIVYDVLTRCPFEREEDLRATVSLLSQLPKGRVTLKEIVLFPFTKIATMDAPRGEVPPDVYHFYEMLYLLTSLPGVEPSLAGKLMDDPWLRSHPEALEQMVHALGAAARERDEARDHVKYLAADKEILLNRVHELEAQMPWGVKRASSHLFTQIQNRLSK